MSMMYHEMMNDECIAFAAKVLSIIDEPQTDVIIQDESMERIRIISRYLSDGAREVLENEMEDIKNDN